jgi:hypothetical protein
LKYFNIYIFRITFKLYLYIFTIINLRDLDLKLLFKLNLTRVNMYYTTVNDLTPSIYNLYYIDSTKYLN